MKEKIDRLVSLCKASVSITFNDHTTNYQTVSKELQQNFGGRYSGIDSDVKDEMIKRNTMVEVQFYPDTPVGFYMVAHYDLDAALDEAIKIAEKEASGVIK